MLLPAVPSLNGSDTVRATTAELNILCSYTPEDHLLLDSLTTLVPTGSLATFNVKPWDELENSKEDFMRWNLAASKTHILNILSDGLWAKK